MAEGDLDVNDLAMLRAENAALRVAIEVIRQQRDTANRRLAEAEAKVEQLEWLARLSRDER